MSVHESILVNPSEKRDPGAWAPGEDDDWHAGTRRYLAFLERHGYEPHATELAAITPVSDGNLADATGEDD